MPLAAYQALDTKLDTAVTDRLFARLDDEAVAPSLKLTGDGDQGTISANLTPAMNAWLNAEVAPARRSALNSIESAAAQIPLKGGVNGVVYDIEDDKLKRHRNERRAEVHKTFHDRHGAEIEDLKEVENEYFRMRTYEGNREPRNPGRLVDLLIPLAIMIPEGFMNYKFFFEYIELGIVALGSTIVVGLGIGWAAYLVGRFWKAYHFYMQPDDEKQRAEGIRMISIALTLLIISLVAVGAVRYFGIARQIPNIIALGGIPPNSLVQTGVLLFGNLLVFGLGAAITYWLHDRNPNYAEKAEVYSRQKEKVDRLRKKELVDKLSQIDVAYKQSTERMKGQADLMNGLPGYVQIKEQIGALSAKDNEVLSVLQEYRGRLCAKLPADKDIFLETGQSVDVPGFAALPIYLYRC